VTDGRERLDRRLFFWSLVAALAGFLFGFDTVVISGAEQTIQRLWGLSRRPTLCAIGFLFLISALGSALASNVPFFIVAALRRPRLLMFSAFHPGAIFLFFCGMMALQLIWVLTLVPETKGAPLEAIQRRLGLS